MYIKSHSNQRRSLLYKYGTSLSVAKKTGVRTSGREAAGTRPDWKVTIGVTSPLVTLLLGNRVSPLDPSTRSLFTPPIYDRHTREPPSRPLRDRLLNGSRSGHAHLRRRPRRQRPTPLAVEANEYRCPTIRWSRFQGRDVFAKEGVVRYGIGRVWRERTFTSINPVFTKFDIHRTFESFSSARCSRLTLNPLTSSVQAHHVTSRRSVCTCQRRMPRIGFSPLHPLCRAILLR